MLPTPFSLGPYQVTPYEGMHLLSIVLAVWLAVSLNRSQGIPARVTLAISVLGALAGQAGSRLLDALEYTKTLPLGNLLNNGGGSSIYGGLLLSFAVVVFAGRLFRVSTLRFLDAGAPAMALAEATTRVGCFLAGCCYGVAWSGPFAVVFPRASFATIDQIGRGLLPPDASHSLPVHPVQLYSVGLALLITGCLILLFRRRRYDGDVFLSFLIAYGGLRLAMAPLRVEKLRSMTFFSVLFILAGVGGLAQRRLAPWLAARRTFALTSHE